MVDASDFAVGEALHQLVDGSWQPMAFYSKRLNFMLKMTLQQDKTSRPSGIRSFTRFGLY